MINDLVNPLNFSSTDNEHDKLSVSVPVPGRTDPYNHGPDITKNSVEAGHDKDTRVSLHFLVCRIRHISGRHRPNSGKFRDFHEYIAMVTVTLPRLHLATRFTYHDVCYYLRQFCSNVSNSYSLLGLKIFVN